MGETNGNHRSIFSRRSTAATPPPRVPDRGREMAKSIARFVVALMAVAATALGSAAGMGIAQAQADPSTDRDALVALYNATDGDNWANNANWLSDEPLGQWYGVTADGSGRVTELHLDENELDGEMPTELGGLSNLINLNLFRNQLTGEIPSELSSLSNLKDLHLSENQLTGAIPTGLGSLSNLEGLFLDVNQLTGAIPSDLGDLSNLQQLWLGENQLTGTIPSELGSLTNLEGLFLSGNRLTGPIPPELGNLTNLEDLYLSRNQLTGCIPAGIAGVANNDLDQLGLQFCAGASGAPTMGTVTPGGGFLTITWAAPTGAIEAAIIVYDLRYIRTDADETVDANWTVMENAWTTGSGGPLRYQITGLTGGIQYDVQVRSVTADGDGPWSATAIGTPTTWGANRSFSPSSAAPGGTVVVTIDASGYGAFGGITETLPAGFSYVSSSLDDSSVVLIESPQHQEATFTLIGATSFTYTVAAPSAEGSYPFSGVLRNSDGENVPVGGALTIEVATGDPVFDRYDANGNGTIEKSEVIAAINDYLFGEGDVAISKAEVIRLINLYLFGPSTPHNPPGAPEGLTAAGDGQTRIDLSWSAPPIDGGAAITGYRIEVSEDRSTWTDLVVDTGNAATSYSHTGLTAGSTRHYRVSAINSAGTGPASNIATGNTDTGSGDQAPDLVASVTSVGDGGVLYAGESFTINAEVHNQGTGPAASTTLRYYRSTDSTISTSDTPVGTDHVDPVAVSGTRTETMSRTAPSSTGTYYYGVCVDSVAGESNTRNNCSEGISAIVLERGSPDLVASVTSVGDGGVLYAGESFTINAGESFTINAEVHNQGTGPAASTTLRYYRSTDSTISTSDTPVGTDHVDPVAVSGTRTETMSRTAPSSTGTYYYGVCVDSVAGESNTRNNCSEGISAIVLERGSPDLVASVTSVGDGGVLYAGESFTINAEVHNQGTGPAASTTLRYYRSTDSTISTSDTPVGTDHVDPVAVSGTRTETMSRTAPSSTGTYHYGVCVDSVAGESNTRNNCSEGALVTVIEPAPANRTPTVSRISPSSAVVSLTTGDSQTFSARATDADDNISQWEWYVDGQSQGGQSLSLTGSITRSFSHTFSSAGSYTVTVTFTDADGASDSVSWSVAVCCAAQGSPDLYVYSPSVYDKVFDPGERFQMSFWVRNQGDGASTTRATLRYYRSADSTISTSDTQLAIESGTTGVGPMEASGSTLVSIYLNAHSSGTYYYGACVGTVAGESNTQNNCAAVFRVTLAAPDLVVQSESVSDSSVEAGDTFTFRATVRNQGNGTAESTTLRYYRSTNSTISASDTEVDTDSVSSLDPSETGAQSERLTAPDSAGTYYYGACVDSVSGESNTGNNCSSGVRVTVTAAGVRAPDLVADPPSFSDTNPEMGTSVRLTVIVRNQGNAEAASTTLRIQRSIYSDFRFTREIEDFDVASLGASRSRSYTIFNHNVPNYVDTFYYRACVDSISGESNTQNNCSSATVLTTR